MGLKNVRDHSEKTDPLKSQKKLQLLWHLFLLGYLLRKAQLMELRCRKYACGVDKKLSPDDEEHYHNGTISIHCSSYNAVYISRWLRHYGFH